MAIETGGIGHTALRVTDLERARKFYVDTLGFPEMLKSDGLILVGVHGTILALRGAEAPTPKGDRFDPFRVGLDHLALTVSDAAQLEGLRAKLDEAGVKNNGVERDELTGGTYIAFYDPDGIAWELYAMPA